MRYERSSSDVWILSKIKFFEKFVNTYLPNFGNVKFLAYFAGDK